MKRRCKTCNGTGKELCEVHGQHTCSNCHGSGCIGKDDYNGIEFINNTRPIPDRFSNPPYRLKQCLKN